MRIIIASLVVLAAACVEPEQDDAQLLGNSAGKQDGLADTAVTLTEGKPTGALRWVCDEGWLDRCNIVLRVSTDVRTRDAARAYVEPRGVGAELALAGLRLIGPDGDRIAIQLMTQTGDVPRDTINMRAELVEGTVFGMLESEHLQPGQYKIDSWLKGEYRLELSRIAKSPLPAENTFYITAYWK